MFEFTELFSEVFTVIGSVIFGLAIAGCVISCLMVWKLRTDVESQEKRIKKLEKGVKK